MQLKYKLRLRALWMLSGVALTAAACHSNPTPVTGPEEAPRVHEAGAGTLTLLHTNDIHAAIGPRPTNRDGSGPLIGGFLALDTEVDRIREARGAEAVLLLDAGDLMTGGAASEIRYDGAIGGGLFELMNRVGYDAWTLGNHEFDGQRLELGAAVSLLDFPTVEANLHQVGGQPLFPPVAEHAIIQRAGLTIGVVGLMTEDMAGVLPPAKLEGLNLIPAATAAAREVAILDPITDVIVFVTHMGVEADQALARAVPGIDVIVGGHSHTRLPEPVVEGSTLIVQTGSHLMNLGKLEITVEADEVVDHSYTLIPLADPSGASPDVVELVEELTRQGDAMYGAIVATLGAPWMGAYTAESNVGDWLCDALRSATGVDVALLNSGGIRTNLPQGPITLGQLRAVLPFDNMVTTFEISGEGLAALALHNARAEALEEHGILQVGGMRYGWIREGDDIRLEGLTVGGEPVDPARTYKVATVDYVAIALPEKYLGAVPAAPQLSDRRLFDVIAEVARETGTIDAALDGRIGEVAQ